MNNKIINYLPSEQPINEFVESVIKYIYEDQSKMNKYIVISNNHLYVQEELSIYIDGDYTQLFIEKGGYCADIQIDINFKWCLTLGYKTILKKEYEKYFHVILEKPKITFLYLTDKVDDMLQQCKKSILKYCEKYHIRFSHQYSEDFYTLQGRLDYVNKNIDDSEYICVIYNYSYIANYDMPVIDIIKMLCFDKYSILFDYNGSSIVKYNFFIRNSRRLSDTIKEMIYLLNKDFDTESSIIRYIGSFLENDVQLSISSNYMNKKGGYGIKPSTLDFLNTVNHIVDYDTYLSKVIITHYSNINQINPRKGYIIFNIKYKTYSIGDTKNGCLGIIQFRDYDELKVSFTDTISTYTKLNINKYEINICGKKYVLIFSNNYKSYIGTFTDDASETIFGYLI
jgi:hypothetical protein